MSRPAGRRPPNPTRRRAAPRRHSVAAQSPGASDPPSVDPPAGERLQQIMSSPAYLRADQDLGLLARDEARAIRLQLEFLKPELLLREQGVRSTIVVFGGTRIVEPAAAQRQIAAARRALTERPGDRARQHALAVAERILAKSHYYDMAREFGHLVSSTSQVSSQCEFVIVTGGGPGIMEAANRGAYDVRAKTVGLNIVLPQEQVPNPYITPDLCFQFRYFALRKMHFLLRAKALVAFPGGYGTLDELFDALCLIQTQKMPPLPVVLVGEAFWRKVFDADFLVAEGVIAPEDARIFSFAESAQEAWDRILDFWRSAGEDLFDGGRLG